jgi:ribosomal-protein-serine acetyltransferase
MRETLGETSAKSKPYSINKGEDQLFYFQINEKTQLKLLETRYSEELYLLTDRDRNYLREWLPWVDGTKSPENTKDFIKFTLKEYANNNGLNAGIFFEERIVGCIGLHGIDWNNKKTSIGYWLGSEYQGKGIMTSSCRAIINHVFEDLGLNRIEIRAAELNKKSRAIPERLGFIQEGLIRKAEWLNDHYVDHVVYGILRDEWGNS